MIDITENDNIFENRQEFLKTQEFRDWLNGLLMEETPTLVTFTKKDGSTRVMKCTKNLSKIPVTMHPSGEKEIKEGSAFRVFDLENNGWRSFNAESVKTIEFNIG